MDLPSVIRMLRRQLLLVVAMLLVGLSTGAMVAFLTPQRYEATAEVFLSVQAAPDAKAGERGQASAYAQQVIESYRTVITSSLVLQPVIDQLELKTTPAELASRIRATAGRQSLVISITATLPYPVRAARLANTVADVFAATVSERLENRPAGASYAIRVVPVQTALVPTAPVAPDMLLSLAVGAVGGLGIGVGVAVLRGVLDTRVRSREDLERTVDLPVLGTTAFSADSGERPLIVAAAPLSPGSESYRTLRTNLGFFLRSGEPGVFAVTSSVQGEGKSTIAANIALSFAEAGRRVVLVDADMRRPRVAGLFDLDGAVGLSDVLAGRISLNDAVQRWRRSPLFALPAGTPPPNPAELLGSPGMDELLTQLSAAFEIVILDTPPLLPVTDAAIATRSATGTLLVVAAGSTTASRLQDARGRVDAAGGRVLGTVLSKQPPTAGDRGARAAYAGADRGS